jgi:hypothetical protein
MISFRVSTAFITLLLLVSLNLVQLKETSGAQSRSDPGDPVISISIDKEEAYVDVAPWTRGEMNFTLTIHCLMPVDAPTGIGVEVRLNSSAWRWDVSDIPLLLFSSEINQIDANLTVTAFINSSAEIEVDLEIWGNWSYINSTSGGNIERFAASRSFVLPFYDLYLGSNNPVKYADVGDWSEFSFNISNRANRDVNVTLEVVKEKSHLNMEFPNGTVFMKKGETKTITFRIRQEPSRSTGNPIQVSARILEDPNETKWDLKLMYYTEPTFATMFYERNFIRLVLIIGMIISVAVGLFLWEKIKREKVGEPVQIEAPKTFKRAEKPTKGLYKETHTRRR